MISFGIITFYFSDHLSTNQEKVLSTKFNILVSHNFINNVNTIYKSTMHLVSTFS